ncbi:MAG: hypothetical protein JO147_13305 [Actinobacteria bacterium]|nr:hypothetical protein [Actinomycetota bacterium]
MAETPETEFDRARSEERRDRDEQVAHEQDLTERLAEEIGHSRDTVDDPLHESIADDDRRPTKPGTAH